MKKELQKLENQLRETSGEKQRKLYVEYCARLVECVEKGEVSEEEAAYSMVEFSPKNFDEWPEVLAIFDAAADAEMPREMSYTQNMDYWDQKTADVLKVREWKKVVDAVENAKRLF